MLFFIKDKEKSEFEPPLFFNLSMEKVFHAGIHEPEPIGSTTGEKTRTAPYQDQ